VPERARPQKAKRADVRIIETTADIRAGSLALRKICPVMRRVHDLVGDPPLRHASAQLPAFRRLPRKVG
jgi:hypothetical protein